MTRPSLALVPLCALLACGAPKEAEDPHLAGHEPTAASPPPSIAVERTELQRIVDAGLQPLLARAELEPVLRGDAFVGFRVVHFEGDLRRVGLQEGDVLLGVGGQPIRTPDEAQRAFESLRSAKSIVLDVERGGLRRGVVTPVVP